MGLHGLRHDVEIYIYTNAVCMPYIKCMTILSDGERAFAERIEELIRINPFLPERIDLEKKALGSEYRPEPTDWNLDPLAVEALRNTNRILDHIKRLLESVGRRLQTNRAGLDDRESALCRSMVFFFVYHRYLPACTEAIQERMDGGKELYSLPFFEGFRKDVDDYCSLGVLTLVSPFTHAHLFSLAFQVARAFSTIFYFIVGQSAPAAKLRARVWESIFTRDMLEHSSLLYDFMGDITTLISGPSGTGKELVARAISFSRYIPFDIQTRRFKDDFMRSFYPLNLSAFSPSLIESELFGHRKGAFTGALNDRVGWLEQCGPWGTVFLDEIGDIDPSIQVKLLRVLESRRFERLGDGKSIAFRGKIIAATNRNLDVEMAKGRFREDLYYRLCADSVEAPSLEERLRNRADELPILVTYLLKRWLRGQADDELRNQCVTWIRKNLPASYSWPGNVRELDRCIRNIVIHGSYSPQGEGRRAADDAGGIAALMRKGELTAEELTARYCEMVYSSCMNYEETGRRLGLDRRTVKRYVMKGRAPSQ